MEDTRYRSHTAHDESAIFYAFRDQKTHFPVPKNATCTKKRKNTAILRSSARGRYAVTSGTSSTGAVRRRVASTSIHKSNVAENAQ